MTLEEAINRAIENYLGSGDGDYESKLPTKYTKSYFDDVEETLFPSVPNKKVKK